MKITMIQFHTQASIRKNIQHLQDIEVNDTNVIVLPELFATYFENGMITQSENYAQDLYDRLSCLAKKNHVYVVGGTIASKHKNMCFIFDPQGKEIAAYAKMHLLHVRAKKEYKESDVFELGNSFCTFDLNGIRCGIVICYDTRFPELTRILAQKGIRILFVPAAFNDQVGPLHWEALLKARAIENEIFVVGVSPYYRAKNCNVYGHSMIIDPFGRCIYEMKNEQEIASVSIDPNYVDTIRERMPLWEQRRNDLYEIIQK